VDDVDWAKLIASGDESAQSRFVTSFHDRIYRWLRYLSASDDAAQELTQETFLEALQSIRRYEGRATLATWLHRVAYFQYTHWLREQRRARLRHAPIEDAAECADPACDASWEALCLREALDKLSEDHRDTFVLHYVQQLCVPEVAEVLGIPPGTVQSRLFHARRRLRELLSDRQDIAHEAAPSGADAPAAGAQDKSKIHEVILQ
jgi:RNA polymerase sigma-70 factor, ECF subfamily